MDPMYAAIKAKRSKPGLMDEPEDQSVQSDDEGDESPMKALVAKLSPDQIDELKSLLLNDDDEASETPASEIGKGAPSSEEKSKINAKMNESAEAGLSNGESDDIQLSMVDRSHADAAGNTRPKSLGERARMAAAQRLRGKGKI